MATMLAHAAFDVRGLIVGAGTLAREVRVGTHNRQPIQRQVGDRCRVPGHQKPVGDGSDGGPDRIDDDGDCNDHRKLYFVYKTSGWATASVAHPSWRFRNAMKDALGSLRLPVLETPAPLGRHQNASRRRATRAPDPAQSSFRSFIGEPRPVSS